MEWTTMHHLDLRHVGHGVKPMQPHAAAFHPTQALLAAAVGTYIIEFDALTGSKISSINIGTPVVRMSYNPTSGHAVIAILEDCTIRSCDFDTEQTFVLHSPEKKTDRVSPDMEVHFALTPLQPVVFFGFHRRMSVTVVGTVEGGRAPTKIKTDLKKPIINIACHPRFPVLYVAYADGLIRAYSIHNYAVHYTLQLDSSIRLLGAGAFAFHPALEWIFVGDRRGTLLAWDVSTERPSMIGITQASSHPITSISWLPMLRLLVTLSRDGTLQVWKTRVNHNHHRPPMQANFFEPAAIESIDIPRILSQRGGESVYPLPRIKALEVHPKLNLAALLFANTIGEDNLKDRDAYTREGRKQLFAVLQSARGLPASALKEKLASLGSSGILADHQRQSEVQEHYVKGYNQVTISDIARKAFLHSHYMESHAKSGPISRLPLISILDSRNHLKDMPVSQPFHLELNFFNKANRVLHYPARAFYVEGTNLMAYSLCSGTYTIYKKLYTTIPGNVECCAKYMICSKKRNLFLVVFEFSGGANEVVLYWEKTNAHTSNNKASTVKGRDAAFIGPNEDKFAILDDDKTVLDLYILPGAVKEKGDEMLEDELDQSIDTNSIKGPQQFMFESEIDRIFSTPIESTLLYACHGMQISKAMLAPRENCLSGGDGHYISIKTEGKKFIKLKINEVVLQVQWQETLRGYVAGILTTERVLMVSADLDILASNSTKCDKGLPPFRSILWVGPALLFSTATAVSMLGWDGRTTAILSNSMPYAVLVGALNDRLLLACPTGVNPKQKKGVEFKSCLVGLLEPLLIGFATMQQHFKQKLDLPEILYQTTSRFDSLRITKRSLDVLAMGSPVCGDLAVSLSQAGPQFTQVLRGVYAIRSLRFSIALSVLKDEFLRSRYYPKCPPTSHLFHRFQQLGYACIKYGQFDSAKETFEVTADDESLLDLFLCHLNPSAMRRLAQKLEEQEDGESELRRHCERILRIRSSGWTQGIFSNFAAETMAPQGAQWGGGNWDINTPTNLKSIPQWELAAEVMPYMKTDDGPIPSIVNDHIGVYLGVIKGRRHIVEVREDSLVKALTSEQNETHESLFGPETVGKLSSSAVDEQAKAEEEFKKSMYSTSVDGSSSDEEGVSKTKKLHIRIRDKPAASTTVDVDKIKEATKQLKLFDGLGLPVRAKSLSNGLQELGQSCSTGGTLTPAVSVPTNLFNFAATTQSPPLAPPGAAQAPIPEDFFQNTIPSFQVAASLPPPGTYISKLDQPANPIVSEKVASVSTADISLPEGDVPQSIQQRAVSPESLALPDVSVSQAAPASGAGSAQPLDLTALGIQDSGSSGKPQAASLQLGQVPRGEGAPACFKAGVAHLEQNHLPDALSCFNEAFLALAKDHSRGADVKAQATICAQYKTAVTLLQEIGRLQRVHGPSAISAKDEMARLSRHLVSLPLLAKHRINCLRSAIKRNMEVQNYAYSNQMLELLLSKAPSSKQDELRSLIDICVKRGASDKSIDPFEDTSQFCSATLSRLSTIGFDVCDLCGAKFSAISTPGCVVCGMGSIKRSDAVTGPRPAPSPFG